MNPTQPTVEEAHWSKANPCENTTRKTLVEHGLGPLPHDAVHLPHIMHDQYVHEAARKSLALDGLDLDRAEANPEAAAIAWEADFDLRYGDDMAAWILGIVSSAMVHAKSGGGDASHITRKLRKNIDELLAKERGAMRGTVKAAYGEKCPDPRHGSEDCVGCKLYFAVLRALGGGEGK